MDEDCGRVPSDPLPGVGPDWSGGELGGHGLQPGSGMAKMLEVWPESHWLGCALREADVF